MSVTASIDRNIAAPPAADEACLPPSPSRLSATLAESFARVQPLMHSWVKCLYMDEADEIRARIKEAAPELDVARLDRARIWAWQTVCREYHPEGIFRLYALMREGPRVDLGPDSCRFCKTIDEIEAQAARAARLLGGNLEAFNRGQRTPIASIERYRVDMHPHPCEYGAGLITYSLFDGERKLFQVSFFPYAPLKIFEIKGAHSDERAEGREILRSVHRFHSKLGCLPASALVAAVMETGSRLDVGVDVALMASRWRNYGIARDAERAFQADKQHRKVAHELGLSFAPVDHALYQAIEALVDELAFGNQSDQLSFRHNLHRFGEHGSAGRACIGCLERHHAPVASLISREDFFYKALFSRFFEERCVAGGYLTLQDVLGAHFGDRAAQFKKHGDSPYNPPAYFHLEPRACGSWRELPALAQLPLIMSERHCA